MFFYHGTSILVLFLDACHNGMLEHLVNTAICMCRILAHLHVMHGLIVGDIWCAGATSVADPLRVTTLTQLTGDLQNSIVAVSHANTPDQLLSVSVAGFLYITNVDKDQRTITYLAPCPGPLPGKYLLIGNLKVFFE